MRALLIDDHVMFLQGMGQLLAVLAPEVHLDVAKSAEAALRAAGAAFYDVILLDWRLGGGTGDELITGLRSAGVTARVVVVSGETDPAVIATMLQAGIAGFIPKSYSGERLLDAMRSVLRGELFLPADLLSSLHRSEGERIQSSKSEILRRLAGLTPRQCDVFAFAARGLPNKLIARELQITEATVKAHLTAVFAALQVENRTQAAVCASQAGIRLDRARQLP